MTTIAFKDGIIASDTLVTSNGLRVGSSVKIGKQFGKLYGAAGSLCFANAFNDWCRNGFEGEPPKIDDDDKNSEGIIIEDGFIKTWGNLGWDRMEADYYALGSGAQVALGAMASGRSAIEAVKIAIELDIYSGGEVLHFDQQ